MALTATHRPTREWPLLVLAVALVCAVCLPLRQWALAQPPGELSERLGRLLLGPEQIICYGCFTWACFILLGRYYELSRQRRAFGLGLLPTEEGARILPEDARPGAELFAQAGCLNCHVYLGDGAQNLGAPELTDEGTKGRGVEWQIDHLECPSCVTPGSPMPSFADLGEDQLRQIAIFLEASKGPGGG